MDEAKRKALAEAGFSVGDAEEFLAIKRLSPEGMAALVVDGLVAAGLVKKADFEKAVEIAAEEIAARLAFGDG